MKRKSLISLLLAALLLLTMPLTATAQADSTVNTGAAIKKADKEAPIVDIEIREYMQKDGALVPFKDQFDLLPGQNVSKIVRIYNLGDECFIRLKYSFDKLGELLDDTIYGISDKWVYFPDDGKWYYTKTLKTGEYAEFFKGFVIPSDFKNDMSEADFAITIEAEAAADYKFTETVTVTNDPPKTGIPDNTVMWIFICTSGICAFAFAVFCIKKRRMKG